ncbi:hypothetical protein [Legionella tunisiensis]|uniref:hypothetical protein n=1 Tax=Legionella tunisiensis TaxID=1034944 RepID=UPI000382E002|nr:hypothetical protein [Legionella tunisiensis]
MSFSKSGKGNLPKLPTEMLRERAQKEATHEVAQLQSLQQKVRRDFRTCCRVAKELAEQLDFNVCVYHPAGEKSYHSQWDCLADFGVHDLSDPPCGGIVVSVDSSNENLCNALKSIGFKEYAKDWSSEDRGVSALLISPWDKQDGVHMTKIESLPEDLEHALNVSPSASV